MVEERALAAVIAGGEEFLAGGGPDGEGEGAEEMVEASGTPTKPRSKKIFGIRLPGGIGDAEGARQLVAVVEAKISHEEGIVGDSRLAFETVLGEKNPGVGGEDYSRVESEMLSIGAINSLCAEHLSGQEFKGMGSGLAPESADAGHSLPRKRPRLTRLAEEPN
jgi:hypothetical protein